MSDTFDDDASGPPAADAERPGTNTVVLKAVFVPDGEDPPPEFQAVFNPLKFSATFDPDTGQLTTGAIGLGFNIDLTASFVPEQAGGGDFDETWDADDNQTGF